MVTVTPGDARVHAVSAITESAITENGEQTPPTEADDTTLTHRYLPIAPPSEPMQYRAIGLVRGTYAPAEADQLNRGNLTTDDGQVIDAVLLGRITSLVKKHVDLTASHLWVVYPRTRREMDTEDDQDLHLQIVGVWEPETLGLPGESPVSMASASDSEDPEAANAEDPEATDAEQPEATAEPAIPRTIVPPDELPEVDDNFFSIRGEVVKYSPEDQVIMVKILQGVKRSPGQSKSFKLMLQGTIEGRTVGYFWDFTVKRDAKVLVMQEGSVVGIVPPKKRPKGGSRRGPAGRRPMGNRASVSPSRRPIGAPERRPTGTQGSPRPRRPIVGKEQTEG
ncbi:MAG: hypothetical protein HC929_02680 [Leptolyngbyaceae cyanobacterium SM2_5_2]|nr:hypothetical protein [Leptolyngbyaceae cyanobacterium SM2_5_2]